MLQTVEVWYYGASPNTLLKFTIYRGDFIELYADTDYLKYTPYLNESMSILLSTQFHIHIVVTRNKAQGRLDMISSIICNKNMGVSNQMNFFA